jgi:hypothetical protein
MRNWIDLLNESANPVVETEEVIETELTEDDLMERSMMGVQIKNKRGEIIEIDVMENPTRRQLKRAYTDLNKGWFRGFLTPEGTIYVFDAYNATHYDVGVVTGLSGLRFEIRGTTAEPMSMLYIASNAGEPSVFRENPMIARMFDDPNYHIGRLR